MLELQQAAQVVRVAAVKGFIRPEVVTETRRLLHHLKATTVVLEVLVQARAAAVAAAHLQQVQQDQQVAATAETEPHLLFLDHP